MLWFLIFLCVTAVSVVGLPVHAETYPAPTSDSLALVEGIELLERESFDAAREKLIESTRSEDARIRTRAFLYLSSLEMEVEDFIAAQAYMQLYHTEGMALFREALETENRKSGGGWQWVVLSIATAAGVLLATKMRTRRKPSTPKFDISQWRRYLTDVEKFRQTAIYSEIVELAEQKERGRNARILTSDRQEALDKELMVVFAQFAVRLQSEYPTLTTGEVKFCCLSLTGLSSWARALCLGSTETNIVKQRKHKIKVKLPAELVGFIFG
jgi:hypothetical protein